LKKSKETTSVVIATTDGFTLVTTSAMLGSAREVFSDGAVGGGVQVGFIGSGGCAGAGAGGGLGAGTGVISTWGMAHPTLSASTKMVIKSVSMKLALIRPITIKIVTQSKKRDN
jgi:hypothetical protein